MKKRSQLFSVSLLYLLFATTKIAYAQHEVVIDSNSNGKINFVSINKSSIKKQIDSKELLRTILQTNKETDFYLYKVEKDDIGMIHEKYQQTFKGIKVEFKEYIIHRDKENNVISLNGDFEKIPLSFDIEKKNTFTNILNKYTSEKKIKKFKIKDLPQEKYFDPQQKKIYSTTNNETVILIKEGKPHLVYKFWLLTENMQGDNILYVDCIAGKEIFKQPLVLDNNAPGSASTIYSNNQNIISDSNNGTFRLRETLRNGSTSITTLDYQRAPAYFNSDLQSNIPNAVDFIDNDNNWSAAEHNNTNRDNAALDVHWATEITVDYFKNVHNRNSYDGNGGTITNYVHVRTRNPNNTSQIIDMDNAFWSSTYNSMFYGDGSSFGPTVSLDVIGHEIGHGVCFKSIGNGTGLAYEKESGALNESLSDIWGACIEHWGITGKQTWLLGEDVVGFAAFRSMSNPKTYSQPTTYGATSNFWYNVSSCTPDNSNDKCGVHTNSGVGNYWFYLLSEGGSGTNDISSNFNVIGIGISDASKIVYRAEVNYLTPTSGYQSMRIATIQAAIDLFGSGSCQEVNTTNAWYGVGVGTGYNGNLKYPITGASQLCTSETYSISSLPSGATVSWSSPNPDIASLTSSGNSVTLTKIRPGQLNLIANINTACGSFSVSKNIQSGPDEIPIGGLITNASYGPGQSVTVAAGGNYVNASNYTWTVYGGTIVSGQGTSTINFVTNQNQSNVPLYLDISLVIATPDCGNALGEAHAFVTSDGPPSPERFVVFPNPANADLTINQVSDNEKAKSTGKKEPYEIKIYNSSGKILLFQKSIEGKDLGINIQRIQNGTYFLHITQGKKVIKKQIIINH